VQVNSDAIPLLKTDRAGLSNTFSVREAVDLPIPDRDFAYLQLLLPGAQQLGWAHAADENPRAASRSKWTDSHLALSRTNWTVLITRIQSLGIVVVNPKLDSLSEAKIKTQNVDASFGRAVSSLVTVQT
jgi:hypothetical protein